jgi:hypothetical protein
MLTGGNRRRFRNSKAGNAILRYLQRTVLSLVAALALAPLSARADVLSDAAQALSASAPQAGSSSPSQGFSAHAAELAKLDLPTLPSAAVPELPAPSIETPLKKLFCVEYARARSGLAVFGDAKYWWARAKNLYARVTSPVENAVMVFTASSRIRKGHVAVVTNIVSSREIRVDQANWQNQGEIDHSTPVLDVSKKNDWSKVRVWDIKSQSFGGHVYAISGFIAKELTRQASN